MVAAKMRRWAYQVSVLSLVLAMCRSGISAAANAGEMGGGRRAVAT